MSATTFTIIDNFLEPQHYVRVDESTEQYVRDALELRLPSEMRNGSLKQVAQHHAGKSSIFVFNGLAFGFDVEFGIFEIGLNESELNLRRRDSTTLIFCFSESEFRLILDEAVRRTQIAPNSTGKLIWGGPPSGIVYRSQLLSNNIRTLELTDRADQFPDLEDFYDFAKLKGRYIVALRKPAVDFSSYLVSTTDEMLFAFKTIAHNQLGSKFTGLTIVEKFKNAKWQRSEMNLLGDEVDSEYRKSQLEAARAVRRDHWNAFFQHAVDWPKTGFLSFFAR